MLTEQDSEAINQGDIKVCETYFQYGNLLQDIEANPENYQLPVKVLITGQLREQTDPEMKVNKPPGETLTIKVLILEDLTPTEKIELNSTIPVCYSLTCYNSLLKMFIANLHIVGEARIAVPNVRLTVLIPWLKHFILLQISMIAGLQII